MESRSFCPERKSVSVSTQRLIVQEIQGMNSSQIPSIILIITFQATAFHLPPRTVMTKNTAGEDIVIGGYEYKIFVAISEKLKSGGKIMYLQKNIPCFFAVSNMIYLCQRYAASGENKQRMEGTLLVSWEISSMNFLILVGPDSSSIMRDQTSLTFQPEIYVIITHN